MNKNDLIMFLIGLACGLLFLSIMIDLIIIIYPIVITLIMLIVIGFSEKGDERN